MGKTALNCQEVLNPSVIYELYKNLATLYAFRSYEVHVCLKKTLARLKACPHWTRIQSALNADPLNAHSIYIDRVQTAK